MAFDDLSMGARNLLFKLLEAHTSGKYGPNFYAASTEGHGWSIRLEGLRGGENIELSGFSEGDLIQLEINHYLTHNPKLPGDPLSLASKAFEQFHLSRAAASLSSGEVRKTSQAEAQNKEAAVDIFISHSSKDVDMAAALIELLRGALNTPPEKIRCTSVDGFRLPAGASTDDRLRREIEQARAFIGLLTPASLQSTYVLFELGARWGARLHLAPVLASGVDAGTLRGPLTDLNALSCDVPAQVHQLVKDIARELDANTADVSAYQKYVDALVLRSKRGRRRVARPKKDEPREHSPAAPKKPANTKYYFLAGCGVGNKIALLPLPPSPNNSPREMDEFLDSLKKIGIQDKVVLAPFLEVRNKFAGAAAAGMTDGEARIIIERFFAAMSALPDMVQDRSSGEEYQWFKFGQLIYDIGTTALVDSEGDNSIITSIMALESLVERMNLPTSLSQEVAKFIRGAKSKKSKNHVFEDANRIALAVYSMY